MDRGVELMLVFGGGAGILILILVLVQTWI